MVSTRFLSMISSVLLLVGALLIGDALHASVVTGVVGLTAPITVIRVLTGAILIVFGYRARKPMVEKHRRKSGVGDPDESDRSERSGTPVVGADADAEFDPSMSPLGDDSPGEVRGDAEDADTEDGPD